MENPMFIRDAVKEDLPTIVDIYNSTIESRMVTADLQPVSVSDREPWFFNHSPGFRPLWVAEIDGEICAWVSFEKFYGRPAYNQTAEISIYIHPHYRGKGIGKELVQRAINECPKLKIKTLLAFIFGHNEPSLKLFERFGFTQMALLPRVALLDQDERDLVILGLRIEE